MSDVAGACVPVILDLFEFNLVKGVSITHTVISFAERPTPTGT
jgi:hypothetical protein